MAKKEKIVVDGKIILNDVKYRRAVDIVNLVVGTPVTQAIKSEYSIEGQLELKAKFTEALKNEGIDAKKNTEDAVAFVYEKLGGGVRKQEAVKAVKPKGDEDEEVETKKSKKGKKDEDDDAPGADDEGEDA